MSYQEIPISVNPTKTQLPEKGMIQTRTRGSRCHRVPLLALHLSIAPPILFIALPILFMKCINDNGQTVTYHIYLYILFDIINAYIFVCDEL